MHFDGGHLSATGAKALFSPHRGLTRPLSIRSGTYNPSVSLAFDSSLYTREPEAYRSRQGVPRPRLPRQCAHCLAMTKDWQRAHYSQWRGIGSVRTTRAKSRLRRLRSVHTCGRSGSP